MVCIKCNKEIPDGSAYCLYCGRKQTVTRRPKSRGNGQGSVFKRSNGTYTVVRTIGYSTDKNGKTHRHTVSKSGFRTKKEALAYLPKLTGKRERSREISFQNLYELWKPTHGASKSTMDCYASAMKWYKDIWFLKISDIDIDDLQECLDECPKGKRTKENMKALCGLLYKFAIPRHYASLNLGQYLRIHAESSDEKAALPIDAVQKLMEHRSSIPFASYIVAQCYLGFRPSELLSLDVKQYDRKEKAFTGGAKTEAGTDRIVTVSPKIQHIIDDLTRDKISGPVFCSPDGSPLSIENYRSAFYSALDAIGLENPILGSDDAKRHKYTPHSCRHTFATLMKSIDAPDKDKLALIGHTSTDMLRKYQDVDYESLRKITNAL